MKKTFNTDIVYITNIPSFYKINLFNKIAEKRNILVIFLLDTYNDRSQDFYKGERNFQFISLGEFSFILKTFKFIAILCSINFQQLIIGGFDFKEYWIAAFINHRRKNAVVIESSIFESQTTGIKGFVKRIFIKRISTAYVSGKAQKELALALNFKGELKITKGVGLFNIVEQAVYYPKKIVKYFVYVGRLSEEKNLIHLIHTFNELPDLQLNIVGFGVQEKELKSIAKSNILFYGAINNKDLPTLYRANDVFILPSLSEPWGLVVEEAFNNGLPVIVSNMVGCSSEIIIPDENGIIFQLRNKSGIRDAILKITEINYYNMLRKNVCTIDFMKIAQEQVDCYL